MNSKQAGNFIYRNARPLDLARWKYLFEGGDREDVLTALAAYQNEDGGFGSALETDCWNPVSSPIQTWAATEILRETGVCDKDHAIIQGILRYLSSGKDFDGHMWANTIASNNDYPHAPWWTYDPAQQFTYNPTASLAGFILKFAEEGSEIYGKACVIVKEAYGYLKEHFPLEMHEVFCFLELYEYLKGKPGAGLVDMDEYRNLLKKQLKHILSADDRAKWATDYVCKPSMLIGSKASDFYADHRELCDYECKFISDTQEADGSWALSWAWADYPAQWSISENWWKSEVIIKNIRFFREMSR